MAVDKHLDHSYLTQRPFLLPNTGGPKVHDEWRTPILVDDEDSNQPQLPPFRAAVAELDRASQTGKLGGQVAMGYRRLG